MPEGEKEIELELDYLSSTIILSWIKQKTDPENRSRALFSATKLFYSTRMVVSNKPRIVTDENQPKMWYLIFFFIMEE